MIIVCFLVLCGILGSLPLTSLLALGMRIDLRQVGTGNVSVAAAFRQGSIRLGIPVVLLEIARGILPVVLAPALGLPSFWGLLGLIPVIACRFLWFQAGGATNWGWGLLVYDPLVYLTALATGLVLWPLISSRRTAVRLGWLSAGLWALLLRQNGSDALAMLTVAALLVLLDQRLQDDMHTWVPLSKAKDPGHYGSKAATLAQLIDWGYPVPPGWGIPADLAPQLDRWIDRIPLDKPLILRSSALDEDGEAYSGAGIYTSVGSLTTRAGLREAAETCLAAYTSPSAIAYREQHKIPSLGMALLIQPHIAGLITGVAFSRHPLDGSPVVVIEASSTEDASVVSGQGIPLHLEIPWESAPSTPVSSLLPPDVVTEIVAWAQALEGRYHGIPQDLEWIWTGSQLYLLQCRPITSLRPIWTRTIAAEVIPGPIRPLTWSINRPLTCGVWGELFTLVLGKAVADLDFTETATLLGSHAYFNATLLGSIFRQMGLPEQGLEFLLRGGKMGKPPNSAYGKLLACLPGLWRLVRLEGSLPHRWATDQSQYFQPALDILAQVPPDQLTQAELLALVDEIQALLKRATLYNIVGPIGFALSCQLLRVPQTWLNDTASPESHALADLQTWAQTLRKSLSDSSHEDPSTGISVSTLEEITHNDTFEQELETFLQKHGYLSEVGTDVAIPCWAEQPDLIRSMVQGLITASPPHSPTSSADKGSLNLWQRWRRTRCQSRLDLKGQIATTYARLLAHLRWILLTLESRWIASGHLTDSGDIFFLTLPDIQSLSTQDPSALHEVIQTRKTTFEADQTCLIPAVVYGSHLPQNRLQDSGIPISQDAAILSGIPASPGQIVGSIRLIKSLADLQIKPLDPGTIVVVPYTDAGWAPLLAQAVGIVAQTGGQLSHGAILAREYGIPAIMNVDQALTLLSDGQTVRMDGSLGQIQLL